MAKLNRRDFFRGLGAGALLLNPLASMLARAAGGGVAKRFIYVFSGNGTILNNWRPTGSATPGSLSLTGSQILAPLNAHRNRITVLQGVHNNIGGPGDDHARGVMTSLTAAQNLASTDGGNTGYSRGQSLDQFVAARYGKKAIVAGCQTHFQDGIFSILSSKGYNQPVTPISDPAFLHSSLFSGIVPSSATPSLSENDVNNVRNKSILDFAIADMARLRARIPTELATKLADHADAIRELERSILLPPAERPNVCSVPAVGTFSAYNDNGEYRANISMQMKNIVYAMACGVSNSAVLCLGSGVDVHRHTWLGSQEDHHTVSHRNDATSVATLTSIGRWYSERFLELLDLLASIPEDGGTMLDNSIVVWGNELSDGYSHSHRNLPFLLAGGAGGRLPGGRYLTLADRDHGELLVSIANAMGISITSFGSGTQALPGLLV